MSSGNPGNAGNANEARAKEIFLDALELDPGERAGFVAEACGDSVDLRRRVLELLAARAAASRVVLKPLDAARAAAADVAALDLRPGDRVGNYVLRERLGEGGFGVVFLADQERPVRRAVALKILKLGMDTRRVVARFDLERHTLARMDHPNIARVLDAGATESGRPYFVMERVDGVPLTAYCDREGLAVDERLRLLVTVCLAVQHAHQKGVIHRDLKPSNVLVAEVDGAPLPKVIDFGIAKALQPDEDTAAFTHEGQILGTPAYMSPEQLRGARDVDTRADVYALGVLLQELITGEPPFVPRDGDLDAFVRAVLESAPRRPSRATHAPVARDLDWIALRALEKDPDRRYPTAASLAADLTRFLEHRPVEAAPPSAWYRARTLLRRHRVAALAALAVLVALLCGGVATTLALLEVREQAGITEAVNQFLLVDLLEAAAPSDEPGRGRDATLRAALENADRALLEATAPGGRFADAPRVEEALRTALGHAFSGLADADRAEAHFARAVELGIRLRGEHDLETLDLIDEHAGALRAQGRFADAEAEQRRALAGRRAVLAQDDPRLVESLQGLALVLATLGRFDDAAAACHEALAILPDDRSKPHLRMRMNLAVALARSQRHDEAAELFESTFAAHREALGPDAPDVLTAQVNYAAFLRSQDRNDEAERLLSDAYERQLRVLGEAHPDTLAAAYNLGDMWSKSGKAAAAETILDRALTASIAARGPRNVQTLHLSAALGRALEQLGRYDEAEARDRFALDGAKAVFGEHHPYVVIFLTDLASVLSEREGRDDELETVLRQAASVAAEAYGKDHPNTRLMERNLAGFLQRTGRDRNAAESGGPGTTDASGGP